MSCRFPEALAKGQSPRVPPRKGAPGLPCREPVLSRDRPQPLRPPPLFLQVFRCLCSQHKWPGKQLPHCLTLPETLALGSFSLCKPQQAAGIPPQGVPIPVLASFSLSFPRSFLSLGPQVPDGAGGAQEPTVFRDCRPATLHPGAPGSGGARWGGARQPRIQAEPKAWGVGPGR